MFRENLAIHVGPEYYRGELRHESQHVDHFNDNPLSIITGWWFQTIGLFSIICGIILPIDELIFFRGVETTNQIKYHPLSSIRSSFS